MLTGKCEGFSFWWEGGGGLTFTVKGFWGHKNFTYYFLGRMINFIRDFLGYPKKWKTIRIVCPISLPEHFYGLKLSIGFLGCFNFVSRDFCRFRFKSQGFFFGRGWGLIYDPIHTSAFTTYPECPLPPWSSSPLLAYPCIIRYHSARHLLSFGPDLIHLSTHP